VIPRGWSWLTQADRTDKTGKADWGERADERNVATLPTHGSRLTGHG
jgi:hypothetical protein